MPIIGVNDLSTCFPSIAAEWHPSRNGKLSPVDVLPKSNRAVTWLCDQGHEWTAKVYHRTDGQGCPYCAGQHPIVGASDLQTVNPFITLEWNTDKNGNRMPSQYTDWSHQHIWWKCAHGHEWQAKICSRTEGKGCPVCSGKLLLAGFNDLATLAPNLAKEWHPERNGDRAPTQVTMHSNLSVWWRGKCGHEWLARVSNRANGTSCPYCNQSRLVSEESSLAVINPALAKQWDTAKNAPLTPKDVTAYCNNAHWWRCEHGHSWKAVVSNRQFGKNCPYCSGLLAIVDENDLATVNPELALQWHPKKNGDEIPSHYLPLSNQIVWWKCSKGHEWKAAIFTRTLGSRCPYCSGARAIPGENDLETLRPDLAKQWHPEKNGGERPSHFLPYSSKKAWWICENGHEWLTRISCRMLGSDCPYCLGFKRYRSTNDLT